MASFVTTWMDPEAKALIAETQDVNMVDTSQYPQCTEMELRCAPYTPSIIGVTEGSNTLCAHGKFALLAQQILLAPSYTV